MRKFVIIGDSCCDLNKDYRTKYDISYLPMHMSYKDGEETKTLDASLDWEVIPVGEYYNMIRNGTRFLTAQIRAAEYQECFEKHLEEGCDILYIACSSALSASWKSSVGVAEELMQKYPGSKIYCIDSRNSSFGAGILCLTASTLRAEGKTIDEVAQWVEENKLKSNQECTVDKLSYLKQAGRVSAATAFFGGLLNVKPIIISDAKGQNFSVEKVKGRKASMERIVERFAERYESNPYQRVYIAHCDCVEEAEELKAMVEAVIPDKDVLVEVAYIGPIVGGSAGPGTLAIYFLGKEVTVNAEA